MANLLELSARVLDGGEALRTNRTTGELSEIAPGIAMIEAFGHVVALETGEGLLVFDTSARVFGAMAVAALREWSREPPHTIVFTHGHFDHVGGARAFIDSTSAASEQRPRVIAHENVPKRFARYDRTNGYNSIINARQFGPTIIDDLKQSEFLSGFVYPDVTYRKAMTVRCGGIEAHLHHALGETDDHTWAWIPAHAAVCCGDLVTWVFPNAGNPQKVQRYPAEWAAALREMQALGPELLLPAHGLPVAGRERIGTMLGNIATALESLVSQVLALMNRGARLDEVVGEVRVPEHLARLPYLAAVYDEPEFVVRNTWRLYGGWWDGNPATLKPAPEASLAAEVAALAGGAAALAVRAVSLAEAGDLRLACHLAEWARQAAPGDGAVREAHARVFGLRRDAELSLMARGIFGAAAGALQG